MTFNLYEQGTALPANGKHSQVPNEVPRQRAQTAQQGGYALIKTNTKKETPSYKLKRSYTIFGMYRR